MARGSDRSSRRLMATVRLSVGRATGSHVAGAGHQARSPAPNPCERLYPSAVDGHGTHGLRVLARRTHAHQGPRALESESETLVDQYFLKARSQENSFGTRVCRVAGAWLGVRGWAGGRTHVATLEGSSLAMYCSAYGLHGCT